MIFELTEWDDHEGLHILTDSESGLRAIVAVHSTHLGPGGGGTRFWTYMSDGAAIRDALRLSRAMSYKNAMAGLALGGGKGVIMRPEGEFDREALFAAYGRALNNCGGTYKTAEDVGVSPVDMDVIARHTNHVGGLSDGPNASGDPSPHTARGVYLAMKAATARVFGTDSLTNRTVAVQGLGHVGYGLAEYIAAEGAALFVADINTEVLAKAERDLGAKRVPPEDIHAQPIDIFAPCALSHAVREDTVEAIQAKLICGAANNQISSCAVGERLRDRGILYCPDYIVNAGGIINVASELSGRFDPDWVSAKVEAIPKTLLKIIERAEAENRTTSAVADAMARERIGR